MLILLFLAISFGLPAAAEDLLWTVRRGDLIEERIYTGELQPREKIEIRVPQIGWHIADQFTIKEVPADGTKVKKGQILVTFEDAILINKRTQLENELSTAEAELKQEQSNLAFEKVSLELEVKRKEMELEKAKLGVLKGELLSEVEREKAVLEAKSKALEGELSQRKLAQFADKEQQGVLVKKLNVQLAQRRLNELVAAHDSLILRAPRDGITYRPFTDLNWTKAKAERGKGVRAGDLLLLLPNLDSIGVDLFVHPSEASFFKVGDPTETRIIALPNLVLGGTISRIDDFASTRKERLGVSGPEGSLTELKVQTALSKQDPRLRPGMSTRTTVRSVVATKVLSIPLTAVSQRDNIAEVTMADGTKRPIELGTTTALFAEVTKGLNEGDRIRLTVPPADKGSKTPAGELTKK